MISFRDVEVVVPVVGGDDLTLLSGVNLELSEQRVAVVGLNGSGKSTLLRLIDGLRLPSSGIVEVDGYATAQRSSEVRRRVGFTFADPLAQLVMSTPVEDVALSLRRTMKKKAERHAAAHALLAARGLGEVAEHSIYDLSGGERQLVALTSVLAVEPSIVVSDEPTTLLDLRNRRMVMDALMEVPQQLIVATHDLDFAAQLDRALWIDHGRVVADGMPGEVIAAYRTSVEG